MAHPIARRAMLIFVSMLLVTLAFPVQEAQASPLASSKVSLYADGSSVLPVETRAVDAGPGSSLALPVVLGQAAVPEVCNALPFLCSGTFLGDLTVVAAGAACSGLVPFIFTTHACAELRDLQFQVISRAGAWTFNDKIGDLIEKMNNAMRDAAVGLSTWIFADVLGTPNSLNSPTLSCNFVEGSAKAGCNDAWFLGQLAIVRSIGLYFIIPMVMVVAIQAIIRGSLYFLLRSVLIMLPVAVLGSVLFVGLAQICMNIADNMAAAIASWTLDATDYGQTLKDQLAALPGSSFGLFTWLWLFVFALAAIMVFIELILREVGVYLAVLFLPLAFCAMVWPSATKYVRRLTEILLGLIFSKVFIIGAFSLGLTAFGGIHAVGATDPAAGVESATAATTSSVMIGAVMLLMAAFAGAKVLALTPAAVGAAEGHIAPKDKVLSKGTMISQRVQRVAGRRKQALDSIQPQGKFQNT